MRPARLAGPPGPTPPPLVLLLQVPHTGEVALQLRYRSFCHVRLQSSAAGPSTATCDQYDVESTSHSSHVDVQTLTADSYTQRDRTIWSRQARLALTSMGRRGPQNAGRRIAAMLAFVASPFIFLASSCRCRCTEIVVRPALPIAPLRAHARIILGPLLAARPPGFLPPRRAARPALRWRRSAPLWACPPPPPRCSATSATLIQPGSAQCAHRAPVFILESGCAVLAVFRNSRWRSEIVLGVVTVGWRHSSSSLQASPSKGLRSAACRICAASGSALES